MYQRPDAANGDSYDPSYRASIYDFVAKHNPNRKCKPYYASDDDPATFADPNALCNTFPAATNVNTAPYQSKLHPYLYGLPRYGQGQAWG